MKTGDKVIVISGKYKNSAPNPAVIFNVYSGRGIVEDFVYLKGFCGTVNLCDIKPVAND